MNNLIDNNKFRVENQTQVDLDEIKLINLISSNSFFVYIFIGVAIFNNLYYLAFALFAFILTFKIQNQQAKNKIKEEIVKDLNLVSNDNLNNKYSVKLGTLVKEHLKDVEVLNFFNSLKKIFGLKYEVVKTIDSQVLTSSKNNAITPALQTDEMLREHTCLMATTGGGKTELLLNAYIESTIARGGGLFSVFGKSDNATLQKVQSISAKYNRLQDVLVYDFTEDKHGKTNSNTINIFELGNAKGIITTLVNIADFESDIWGKGGKVYLTSFLKFILTLRDVNFFIDYTKIDTIYNSNNKLEDYKENIKSLDTFAFAKIITDNDLLIKLLIIFDEIYIDSKNELNEILYQNFKNIILEEEDNNTSLSYLRNEEKNQFHSELKQVVVSQSRVENWESLKKYFQTGVETENGFYKGIEALTLKYPSNNGVFYNLSVSIDNLKNLFNFFDSFPSIFKNQSNDISILDAIDSNKIVIFNIPGQNKVYAPVLAEMTISFLNALLERRGKDYKSDTTTLILLDEANSWLKTKRDKSFDIGDIMSVIRGLNMAAVLSFQSSLKKTLGEVDSSQVFANTNTIISLKLTDKDLIEALNKKVEKVKKLELEENQHKEYNHKNKNQSTTEESKYTKSEEDYFKPQMLSSIKKGEGFIIRNGHVAKFMSNYVEQKPMYKTEKDEVFLNKYISLEELKKELL
ncbi:TraM recognition domain-containing protein [Arcobacter cryaerophilus gv. pseudocryaerophilus]|uniref:TraM recognition domain-containing protein n=3 Tax=unclassified Arcobacter TaxID=2593671 RepID=A0AA96L163_9BACT|nr:TraM recognition domain-containing protein [Arcobacter sp. AZ-2023]WPD05143.1 TraM recognition domain-containing protein [Arcobacter sp. DSM 115956]WPD07237.1 TraM recognition domain-containing protein [Arcobacter sp. DSM 115955]WNL31502.1 TraM recognition domain-containing protein [Arcobacter sp. AZ-2023]WNP37652.1 TraM recognition domain-containing protein [Arcobacter sp. AZ-2023]